MPSVQEVRETAVDLAIPDEIQQLEQFVALALAADDLAPNTAKKAFELAYSRNGNLRRIGALPLVLDISSGELFGMTTSVLNGDAAIPGQLTSLGTLQGFPGVMFVSEDNLIGFQKDELGNWGMYARTGGSWEKL